MLLCFFFIPSMLIGTFGLFHFMPLLVALRMAEGHKVNMKQNILRSFSCTLLN